MGDKNAIEFPENESQVRPPFFAAGIRPQKAWITLWKPWGESAETRASIGFAGIAEKTRKACHVHGALRGQLAFLVRLPCRANLALPTHGLATLINRPIKLAYGPSSMRLSIG